MTIVLIATMDQEDHSLLEDEHSIKCNCRQSMWP